MSAERRLDEHLELLRADRPEPSGELVRRVARTARWQRAVRAPLRVMGNIAGALVDAIVKLVNPNRRGRT